MKSDKKLVCLLFVVALGLTFASHIAGHSFGLSLVFVAAFTITPIIFPPAILAYRRRGNWMRLASLFMLLTIPSSVIAGIVASNIDRLDFQEVIMDLPVVILQAYLIFGPASIILLVIAYVLKNRIEKRFKGSCV